MSLFEYVMCMVIGWALVGATAVTEVWQFAVASLIAFLGGLVGMLKELS